MSGQTLSDFIERATEPDAGLAFLRSWNEEIDASAASYFEKTNAKYWFLILGYLDEYWRVIEENSPESPSSWTNVEQLEFLGVVLHATGFRRHPSYIPYARKYGMLDLWEARGAPNFCNKSGGQWACD